jgi:hypothetical protein
MSAAMFKLAMVARSRRASWLTPHANRLVACFALLLAWCAMPTIAQDKPDAKSEIGGLKSKLLDVNGVKAR